MTETNTKTYNGYLIVDWRDDDLRFRKTKPSKDDRGPTEYPVEVEVEVEVPEFDIQTLAAELTVPEAQIRQAVASDLLAETSTPEWHAAGDRALDHYADEAHGMDPRTTEFDDLVSTAVGYAMRNADGLPPVERVEEHITNALAVVANGGESE